MHPVHGDRRPRLTCPTSRKLCRFAGLFALFCGYVSGCGGGAEPYVYEPDEEEKVRSRVADMADAKRDPEQFRELFTSASAPDDAAIEEYRKYDFYAKSVSISGDSATASVEAMHPQTGEVRATLQWKLQRADGEWKIAESPLPK
jgi:hypothetical protein